MKRNKLISIAAITVALGVLATGCAGGSGSSKSDSKSSGGTKTITVKAGTGANVKPYTYVGEDNETTGYDVEVLKEVFERLDGYDLQLEVTDIPSVFSGVTSGTYQIGVNNFSYNEERAKSYLYSYPYDKIGYVFVTKKGAPEVRHLQMQQENLLKDSLVSVLQQQSKAGMKRIRIRKSTLLIPMQIQRSHYSISKMEQQILRSLMSQCITLIRKNITMISLQIRFPMMMQKQSLTTAMHITFSRKIRKNSETK